MSPNKLEIISGEIISAFPRNPKTIHLATSQFDDARSLHIESSKPDPIAKKQLKGLVIQWENHPPSPRKNIDPDTTEDQSKSSSQQPCKEEEGKQQESFIISGTLSLSGEHATVYIKVECQWTKRQETHETNSLIDGTHDESSSNATTTIENIFYFELTTGAALATPRTRRDNAPSVHRDDDDDDDDSNGDHKIKQQRDLNDDGRRGRRRNQRRKAVSKARVGVAMRLASDPYVRKLFRAWPPTTTTVCEMGENKNYKTTTTTTNDGGGGGEDRKCPMFLCNVAIRLVTTRGKQRHGDEGKSIVDGSKEGWQSCSSTSTSNSSFVDDSRPNVSFSDKMEEKYDVSDDALEALRRSIFSHLECNLSVLEFLLDMPWLQRRRCKSNCPLAGRAALCLLEDAMFDACEKEGEDEMLDDLDISDKKNTCRDGASSCSKEKDSVSSKRLKCSSSNKKAKK